MDNAAAQKSATSIRVSTGARLHFGLFDVKAPFGGVGLMVDHPRTIVSASHAAGFAVVPGRSDRIVDIAKRLAPYLHEDQLVGGLPKCIVGLVASADAHCGLGSGTQLSLAAAVAMTKLFGLDKLSRADLIDRIASRGRRSSIGSIGFFEGGLVVEDGNGHDDRGHWQRTTLPEDWRVVLACPDPEVGGISGEAEGAAFASLPPAKPEYRAALVQLGVKIVASAAAGNFEPFCDAVQSFNQMSGSLFAPHQGGCFNGPAVTSLVNQITDLGFHGVGQSSWGPTVFAFYQSQSDAIRLTSHLGELSCRIVRPQVTGFSVERSPSTS